MIDPKHKRYLYNMLSIFGAIALSLILFFIIYGIKDLEKAFDTLSGILAPFIYGSVMAYLLRPLCNYLETFMRERFRGKMKKFANSAAVGLSLIIGILVVYALLIMIIPQVYESAKNLWNTLPEKVTQLIDWLAGIFGEDEELLYYLEYTYSAVYNELDSWARDTLVPSITSLVSGVGLGVWKISKE